MALISLRQLLDHAAENDYGVPAFNINNMEQGLAIMNAAKKADSAGHPAGLARRALLCRRHHAAPHDPGADRDVSRHPDRACTRTTATTRQTCLSAIKHGFTCVMMDGSLKADMKTPADWDYNVAITERVARMAHWVGASVEGELGVLGSLETGEAAKEDGSGAEGKLSKDQLLTDPDEAKEFVEADQGRRAGDRLRHLARRLQVLLASRPARPWRSARSRRSTPRSRTCTSSCTARPRCRSTCRT